MLESDIRMVAYGLWEKEGRPEGRDREHWLRAVEMLRLRGSRTFTFAESRILRENGREVPDVRPGTLMHRAREASALRTHQTPRPEMTLSR